MEVATVFLFTNIWISAETNFSFDTQYIQFVAHDRKELFDLQFIEKIDWYMYAS
jgi:hypothetical protein